MPTDRIWAPWRIDYILGPKGEGCPFCTAPTQGVGPESLVLALWPNTFVTLNRYPYTGGHLMVIPREHVSSLTTLPSAVYAEMMELVRLSARCLEAGCRPDGINIGMNLGAAAGAGIAAHLHVHLVPRWAGDNNFMAVVGGARVVSQGLEHAWQRLRPHFQELDDP